jgi:hypothetical protein
VNILFTILKANLGRTINERRLLSSTATGATGCSSGRGSSAGLGRLDRRRRGIYHYILLSRDRIINYYTLLNRNRVINYYILLNRD